MKKIFSRVLVVIMTAVTITLFGGSSIVEFFEPYSSVFAVSTVSAASVYGDYEYTILDDGTVEISRYNGSGGDVTIPSTIGGKTVTSIGSYAFSPEDSTVQIGKVTIPDSVTVIGEYAFYMSSLTEVTLPKNLKQIKPWAFQNTPITSIAIPEGVNILQRGVFKYCGNLTSVSLPNSLIEIQDEAFENCQALEQIIIPDSVKKIRSSVFENCYLLSSINLPQTITEISDRMFYKCASLTSITIPNNVIKIGEQAFCGCTTLQNIGMPSVLKYLGDGAFSGCTNLSSLTLPDSVEDVGSAAFSATNISNINFPKNLNTVGENPFKQTPYATVNTKSGGLYWKNWLISYDDDATSVTIKAGTEHIADAAFMESHVGGTISLPYGIKTIGERTFLGSFFTEITIPDSVTKIGRYAFDQCLSLEKIVLSKNLSSIEAETFSYCYQLKSLEIPESVTYIGSLAFFESGIVRSQTDSPIKYVDNWIVGIAKVSSKLTIREGVVGVAENVFYGSSLSEVIIPKSVQYIAPHSFNYKDKNLKFYCYSGSAAEKYAKSNQIAYKLLDLCAKGHKPQKIVTQATAGKDGKIVTKCSVCGKNLSETAIKKVSDIRLAATSYIYDGKAKTPSVSVKDSAGKTLKVNIDYTVTYATGRKNVERYSVTIKLKGNYSGTVKKTFTIQSKSTSISKLTPGNKKLTVKWKKQAIQTTGYQIQYATSSKFKDAKTVTISKNKTTSKAISKLKAKKKYYVRIRSYKTVKVNGKSVKLYSSWSKVRSVKTK